MANTDDCSVHLQFDIDLYHLVVYTGGTHERPLDAVMILKK